MSIRFIQRDFNSYPFFIGHYEDIDDLYQNQSNNVTGTFGSRQRVQESLDNQGWISLLWDDLQVEYRIEVV